MKTTRSQSRVFALAGLCSSVVTGILFHLPVLLPQALPEWSSAVFLVPGICFGVAISYAVHTTVAPLSFPRHCLLVTSSTTGFLYAILSAQSFVEPEPSSNYLLIWAWTGVIAGGTGSVFVAGSLMLTVTEFRNIPTGLVIILTGALAGAVSIICSPLFMLIPGGAPYYALLIFLL